MIFLNPEEVEISDGHFLEAKEAWKVHGKEEFWMASRRISMRVSRRWICGIVALISLLSSEIWCAYAETLTRLRGSTLLLVSAIDDKTGEIKKSEFLGPHRGLDISDRSLEEFLRVTVDVGAKTGVFHDEVDDLILVSPQERFEKMGGKVTQKLGISVLMVINGHVRINIRGKYRSVSLAEFRKLLREEEAPGKN